MRWFEEIWNQRRRETITELLHPGCLFHEGEVQMAGVEAFQAYFDRMQETFSDFHMTVHEALADGDKCCLRWSCAMTHTGLNLGIPPTGKTVRTTGISIMRVQDGKFVEGWQNWDMLAVLQALGLQGQGTDKLAASA